MVLALIVPVRVKNDKDRPVHEVHVRFLPGAPVAFSRLGVGKIPFDHISVDQAELLISRLGDAALSQGDLFQVFVADPHQIEVVFIGALLCDDIVIQQGTRPCHMGQRGKLLQHLVGDIKRLLRLAGLAAAGIIHAGASAVNRHRGKAAGGRDQLHLQLRLADAEAHHDDDGGGADDHPQHRQKGSQLPALQIAYGKP